MPDPETSVLLGKILAGQESNKESTTRIEGLQTRMSDEIVALRQETTHAFGDVQEKLGRYDERAKSHEAEDNRRFDDLDEDVNRLHAKTNKALEASGAAHGMSTNQKVGVGGGAAVVVGGILTWLANFFGVSSP